MKRIIVIAGAPALMAAVLVTGASSAQAGEHHRHHNARSTPTAEGAAGSERGKHHAAGCDRKCTPAPKPPAGGWPCQTTHSCKPPKVPHCPRPKPPHKPPVKPPVTPPTHVTPKPPIVHTPVHHATPATPPAAAVPQLPRTGPADMVKLGGLGLGGIAGGAALLALTRQPKAQRKAWTR